MSYPKDLDEYDEDELQAEIDRRAKLTMKGLCTYCERGVGTACCRFPERHSKKGKIKTPSITIGDTVYTLTEAFCEGALAFHNGVPWNLGNPYHEDDDRHEEWSDGHGIASGDEVEGFGLSRKKAEAALKVAKARKL